jgi:hypothetical protein
MTAKRVTYKRADRVIRAIVDLIECDDFEELTGSTTLRDLDRAADQARALRDKATAPTSRT